MTVTYSFLLHILCFHPSLIFSMLLLKILLKIVCKANDLCKWFVMTPWIQSGSVRDTIHFAYPYHWFILSWFMLSSWFVKCFIQGIQLGKLITLFFKDLPPIVPLLKQLRKPHDKKKLETQKIHSVKMHVNLRRLALISAQNILSKLPSFCDQSTKVLKRKTTRETLWV
jgi:hypothetical protein